MKDTIIISRPSRKDLLKIVGILQDKIGLALAQFNDRNPNRQEDVENILRKALTLCIDARSFDPPDEMGE